jgi:tRNA pseudouridine38-40 synthase
LTYDGTAYLGWQKTKMGPSIEEALEKALSQVLQHSIHLQAASRTDAGVHAAGQVANFFTTKEVSLDKLKYSLNCILPKDIAVKSMEEAPADFHPTLDCKSKEYHYRVCFGPVQIPQQRLYEWHYFKDIDIAAIKETIPMLIGERDFAAFCNTRETNAYAHYRRFLQSIEVVELPRDCLRFEIKGNNFLYKMVRNLIGTLVYVGCGKIEKERVPEILLSQDRTQAGMTAPAHGLCLHKVNY